MRRLLRSPAAIACAAGAGALALYAATLLPGFDFGDTASFQVMGGAPLVTPRDGYPLYFAVSRLFAWFGPTDPARMLNLASAVEAAVAVGLFVLVARRLCDSLAAAVAAAAVFAGSYTFWSQAVIAEVYALHICLLLATLLLLLRWQERPTLGRLAAFFAVYAVSFGNHLSMILMLPAYALFLLIAVPGRWRLVLAPRVVLLATALALLGALQYAWNFHALWRAPQMPAGLADAWQTFWFDVTKSDWRDTMVLRVPAGMAGERFRLYAFELRQQFGWVFVAAAAVGFFALAWRRRSIATALGAAYLANVLFALGYSVGDSHVFFLPSHLVVALLIAPGVALLDAGARTRGAIALAAAVFAALQIYDNYPALDRHDDSRPEQVLGSLTAGLTDRNAVLLTDLNWQVQNGLTYFAKYRRPDLAAARLPDLLLYAPAIVRDNRAIDRVLVASDRAGAELAASYGPLFTIERDPRVEPTSLSMIAGRLAPGTRYVLCVLKPTREFAVDSADVSQAIDALTAGRQRGVPSADYVAVVGMAGGPPAAVLAGDRPYRARVRLDGLRVEVRMESWLGFDTIRRMGFAQVVAGRRHTLIVERGVSFVAFDGSGRPLVTAYRANIFAPLARYLVDQPPPSSSRTMEK